MKMKVRHSHIKKKERKKRCDPGTKEEDIEEHLSDSSENASGVKAHKIKMTHNYCTTFTATISDREIKNELFLDSDSFLRNVKAFLG